MNARPVFPNFLFWLTALPLLAQQSETPAPHIISLDVAVSDKSGRPVLGLQQQDFTLLDNKQPQKIVSFHAVEGAKDDPLVEVILVVDEVNASFHQEQIFRSIVTLSDQLGQARITLVSIDPLGLADSGGLRTSYYKAFLKGVRKPSQVQFGNLGLRVLATQSDGLVLNSSNDVAAEIAKCVADANAFYVLSFDGLPGNGPDDYHALEIKVDRPGVLARTRTGYYAQP